MMMFIPPFPPKNPNKPDPQHLIDSIIGSIGFVAFCMIGFTALYVILKRITDPNEVFLYMVYLLGVFLVYYGGIDFITSLKRYASRYTYSMIFLFNAFMTLIFTSTKGYGIFEESVWKSLLFFVIHTGVLLICIMINVKVHHREHWFLPKDKYK